ncbi:MAG TPA: DUF2851 family protein [Ktedonobacteraceae bacterium]|nr:DUF2851 family protein [Ktedonobacteraceae bacterium]
MTHYEQEVAQRWWAMPPGSLLPLSNGDSYQLLFAGRPGGASGPDVRDAVFCTVSPRQVLTEVESQGDGEAYRQYASKRRRAGDVEFHVRASDWVTHQHHTDPRYNHVILHVVLICDDPYPTVRQDGIIVPVCSLSDLPNFLSPSSLPLIHKETVWPCQQAMVHLDDEERYRLLQQAGLLRFEQKTHAFVEQLHSAEPIRVLDIYDICLLPALAEGLGYGRDRDFFRAVGLHLLLLHYPQMSFACIPGTPGQAVVLPEPLGRSALPAPLDSARLRVLSQLVERWHAPGVWRTLHNLLITHLHASFDECLQALRALFGELGLSLARTDILIINVVLPFAAAVALLERDVVLAERAQELYIMHPGLSSNSITRMMCTQLQLPQEPQGSCQQQGLHYIYQQTCREKRCDVCMVGRKSSNL